MGVEVKAVKAKNGMKEMLDELGLKLSPDKELRNMLRLTLMGRDEVDDIRAEYSDFSMLRKNDIRQLIEFLKIPNCLEFLGSAKDSELEGDADGEIADWVLSNISIPHDEFGYCKMTGWTLTYYAVDGVMYPLDLK